MFCAATLHYRQKVQRVDSSTTPDTLSQGWFFSIKNSVWKKVIQDRWNVDQWNSLQAMLVLKLEKSQALSWTLFIGLSKLHVFVGWQHLETRSSSISHPKRFLHTAPPLCVTWTLMTPRFRQHGLNILHTHTHRNVLTGLIELPLTSVPQGSHSKEKTPSKCAQTNRMRNTHIPIQARSQAENPQNCDQNTTFRVNKRRTTKACLVRMRPELKHV